MAKCDHCSRPPQYGNNRPWSKKATRRRWSLNVQKVKIMENGQVVSKALCTSCLRTATKSA